jgi:hypothetical protein
MLAIYFFLLLGLDRKDRWIARYAEPVMHFYVLVVGMGNMIAVAAYKAFVPSAIVPGTCAFVSHPWKCQEDPNMECQKSPGDLPNWVIDTATGTYVYVFSFFVTVISMVTVVFKVRQTEKKIQRYAGSIRSTEQYKRTKETGVQALLYILGFFLALLPLALTQIKGNATYNFVCVLLFRTVSILQGVFNAYIFLRKKFEGLSKDGQPLHFMRRLLCLDQRIFEVGLLHRKPKKAPTHEHVAAAVDTKDNGVVDSAQQDVTSSTFKPAGVEEYGSESSQSSEV